MEFINFEDNVGGIASSKERRDDTGIHVVTTFIGGHGVGAAHCCGEHAGGGGFTIGACDKNRWSVVDQSGHDVRIYLACHQATDHATGSATRGFGRGCCNFCGDDGGSAA